MNALQGYSIVKWPELAANRRPSNESYVAAKRVVVQGETPKISTAVMLLAVSRIIAAYCSVSDLLLAIECPLEHEAIRVLRITWDQTKTWNEAILQLDALLITPTRETVPVSLAKEVLSAEDPCLALFTVDGQASSSSSKFPCHFDFDTSTGTLTLISPVSLLHPTVTDQLIGQAVELVINALQHPEATLHALPKFSPHLISIYNRLPDDIIATVYPHISPVLFAPDYLAIRAKDMPNAIAISWYPDLSLEHSLEPESMTYLELDRRANQVSHWLLTRGLQKEDRVAVCLDRNLHFHAAMIGIMRAGGCYVPIDPELPLERKTYIAKDAAVAFVLTSSQLVDPSVFGVKGIFFEDGDVQADVLQQPLTEVEGAMDPDALSYMLYTSGTTGNPKGCLLTHRGLAQAILALSSTAADVRMDNIHDGRYLAVASIAFDVHLAETIVPMALGMPLLSARRSHLLESLPSYVNLLGVTHLGIVPSLIEATLNASKNGTGTSDIALRYIASGGEKMSDAILDKWADHPQVRLANFYGPSEVTIGCCARYMSSTTPRANIGRPLANVSAYVVDDKLNILPRGAPGELVVEGPLVGRGYHGRDDLTAKVFMEWPQKGCWAYRTGDLVRMMPDSTVEILGRIDTQIKLRGVRIESEGISSVVRGAVPPSNDLLVDAVTILAKHPSIGVEQLVSLFSWQTVPIAIRKSQLPSVTNPPPGMLTQIKAKCNAELASYMRPSHFIPLSWLPLSSNGKTDAKLLTQLFNDLDIDVLAGLSSIDHDDGVRACTETENKIFEVLNRYVSLPFNQGRPDMSVFECGLDSMAVIRFTSELKTVLGSPLSASDVMKSPILSDIAALVEKTANMAETQHTDTLNATLTIPQELYSEYSVDTVQLILPPFPCQEGVLSRSIEQDTLYVQHVVVTLREGVSSDCLRKAWEATCLKQPILRTVFYFGRSLYQVVLTNPTFDLIWDERQWSDTEPNHFSEYFIRIEGPDLVKQINSKLSSIPAYRLTLYTTSHGHRFLVLSIHHSLFDGISLPLLFDEVEREYSHKPNQQLPPTPAEVLAHIPSNLSEAETFWKADFKDFAWPMPAFSQSASGHALRCVVPFKATLSSLKNVAAAQHVTLQALLTCAFSNVLAREVYGCNDVAFGVLRSGRLVQVEGIDSAICPLLSVVPMRVKLEGSDSVLRDIQSKIAALVDFEHVPLGSVQRWLRPGQHLFEVLFSLSVKKAVVSDLWVVLESEPPKPDYPLAVEFVLDPATDSLSIQAAWSDYNQTANIHQWLHDFEDVVKQVAHGTNAYLTKFPSSSDGAWRQSSTLLSARPETTVTATLDPIVFQLLRQVAAKFMQINPEILTPTTSLISMGLDSIKSVGLAKLLVKEGLRVTSTDLLQAGTFAAVAARISSQEHNVAEPVLSLPDLSTEVDVERIRLVIEDEVTIFPTTVLQAGMLSQTVNSGGKLYVHAFPLLLRPNIDLDRMKQAWKEAIASISILRTTFHFSNVSGTWVQAVHSKGPLPWSQTTVNSVEEYEVKSREFLSSIHLCDEESFNTPPLWLRTFSVQSTPKTTYLVIAMHHALYDGLSVPKLLRAVEELYNGDPPVSRKQFHELLPQFIQQERDGTQIWADKLRRYNPCRLSPLHSEQFPVFAELSFNVNQAQVGSLLKRAGVTPQCVAQAAWVKVIARESRCQDVVFGHTVSGRSTPASEDVIGPVLNTVPFMIRLGRYMQNIDLLRNVHQSNVDSLPWHHASLRDIQKAIGVESLWDSLFLYQLHYDDDDGSKLWEKDPKSLEDVPKIQYPLNVEVHQHPDRFTIQCASRSDFFDQTDLRRLLDSLQSLIEGMIREPDSPITFDLPDIFDCRMVSQAQPKGSGIGTQVDDEHSTTDITLYQQLLAELSNIHITKISARTPLVALGIDSITAIQIASKLRSSGWKLATTDIISSRTVGEMVSRITPLDVVQETKPTRSIALSVVEIELIRAWLGNRANNVERFSLASPGMKWLIRAWQRSRGTRYHHAFAFKLPLDVDAKRLRLAWSQLIKKHWLLRSTFCFVAGLEDVRIVTFKDPEDSSWMEENSTSPLLDTMKNLLSQPPALRMAQARALLLTSSGHLILHLHHFQYDAWSLALLVTDLIAFYHGEPAQSSSNVDAFMEQYSSREDHLTIQEEYWRRSFTPDLFQPSYVTPFLDSPGFQSTRRMIKTKRYTQLDKDICSTATLRHQLSLQSIYLACWSRIQSEITRSSTVTFGLWHSGRTGMVEGIDCLAAPCINILPMRVDVSEEESLIELARRLQIDLQRRSDVVEQSEQAMIHRVAGLSDRALCNVFINIIKTGSKTPSPAFLEPVEAPYWVPEQAPPSIDEIQDLPLTALLRDDIMIDIGMSDSSIIMSIDAGAHMMDEARAVVLMDRWADKVENVLKF